LLSPSLQLAASQNPPVQPPLEQSAGTWHAAPPPHEPQVLPPQSMSVSPGSSCSLRQDSGAQRAAEQIRVLQSGSAPQLDPIAQG
jgi:hypothetical protein